MSYQEARPEKISSWPNTLLIASPHGQCAGVVRAIEGLRKIVENHPGQTVYGFHEIVHNNSVANSFRESVVFVSEMDKIPDGALAMVSAHGAEAAVFKQAEKRGITMVNGTCPFVNKVHNEVERYAAKTYKQFISDIKGMMKQLEP